MSAGRRSNCRRRGWWTARAADAQRAALKDLAGSDRAVDDLLRDSVTAPFIIKVHDVKATGATVRQADVWFAVHGDLKSIDPCTGSGSDRSESRRGRQHVVSNPTLESRRDPRGRGQARTTPASGKSWYAHVHAKLLDRIDFEVTNHVVASQSPESIVIASATDPSFANGGSTLQRLETP